MSFEHMFRTSVLFINDFGNSKKEQLLYEYIEKIHNELHVSYEVIKRLLNSINKKLPEKYTCSECKLDIVENPYYFKCIICRDYIHTNCTKSEKYCSKYCSSLTPRPTIEI